MTVSRRAAFGFFGRAGAGPLDPAAPVRPVAGRRGHRLGPTSAARRSHPVAASPADPIVATPLIVYFLLGLFALTFAALSLVLHDSFRTNAFDLGNLDQAVWNTSQGRWFEFTNWSGGTTRLAAHVEPILVPLSVLYWVWSSPKALLVLQAVVVALGALPAYWLARDALRSSFAGLAFAAVYLLAPELQAAVLRDFHPVTLAAPFLLFAFYFAERARWLPCFVFAVLAMSTKEEIPLSVALLGLYLVVIKRQRIGWLLGGVALVWFIVAVGIVLPAFNNAGASPYLDRYSHLGDGPGGILLAAITRPHDVIASVLIPPKLAYLQSLFGPVLFLSLLSPLTLALGLPDLALNLLSNYEGMYLGGAHYSAPIMPFIVVSAIYGARRLAGWVERLSGSTGPFTPARVATGLGGLVLLASLTAYTGTTLRPLFTNFPRVTEHHRTTEDVLRLIPPDVPVAASSGLNPHLSQRRQISLFPEGVDQARYVALDVTAAPYPLDAPSQWWRVQQMLAGGEWGITAARDGVLVLERGGTWRDLPPEFFSFTVVANPQIAHRRDARFDGAIDFLGYDLAPGQVLHGRDPRARVSLYFQAVAPIPTDYRVVVQVTDLPGTLAGQFRHQPATVWLPTSRWQPGTVYRVDVAGVSPFSLRESDLWLALERGPVEQPAPAAVRAEAEATVNSDRQAVKLTTLRWE